MVLLKILQTLDYGKLAKRSVMTILFGIIVLGVIFPMVLKFAVKSQLRVTPESKNRELFERVPFAIDFEVYLFNITNPQEVVNGGKPILHEIGPYFFDEYKHKENFVDNETDDTVEYDFVNTFIYRPEKNGAGLTGDEIITIAHPMIMAMILAVNVERAELLDFVMAAIDGIFDNPSDVFYTGSVKRLLFEGIKLDCSKDAYEVSAVCSELESDDYPQVRQISDSELQFSLLGNSNGTSIGRFRANRGKKSIKQLGNVVAFDGETELTVWDNDDCNKIIGTDGTIFPPFQTEKHDYLIFVPPLCRTLTAKYVGKSKYSGVKTKRFRIDIGIEDTKNRTCYCRDDDKCPSDGTFDLYPCAGVPITVSAPHFYNADPAILEKLNGLEPNKKKHAFNLDFYQYAGAPMSAHGRVQLSFEVVPVENVELMRNIQAMFLPFLRIDEGTDLNKKFTNMIKYQLDMVRRLVKLLKYICIIGGLMGIAMASLAHFWQLDDEKVANINIEPATDIKPASYDTINASNRKD